MKQLLIFMLLVSSVLVLACSVSLYKPSAENAAKHQIPLTELEKGRSLYLEHCSGCHNLHAPNALSAEAWRQQLTEMQKKAEISDAVRDLIYNYLISE